MYTFFLEHSVFEDIIKQKKGKKEASQNIFRIMMAK